MEVPESREQLCFSGFFFFSFLLRGLNLFLLNFALASKEFLQDDEIWEVAGQALVSFANCS